MFPNKETNMQTASKNIMNSKQKVWLLTDLHLDHEMLVAKGFREHGYEIEIFANINSTIKRGDIFICIGDVAFGNSKLNNTLLTTLSVLSACTKVLVRGNHDTHTYKKYIELGWDFVCDSFTRKRMGYNILFSHVPQPIPDNKEYINIFGHWHNNPNRYYDRYKDWITNRHIQIGIEDHYSPFNLDTLLKDYRIGKNYDKETMIYMKGAT